MGVVVGFPALTALAGALRAHERPSAAFWCASALGSFTVVGFALVSGGGSFHLADVALLGAVVLAAFGYAEGGRLAKQLGGWQVICWALVFAAPLLVVPVGWRVWQQGLEAPPLAWAGFAYVSVFSMFLGFFAWFHGLSVGGVARVSQLQLLQPFFTLFASALFLGERLGLGAIACAAVVALSIFVARRSKITVATPATGEMTRRRNRQPLPQAHEIPPPPVGHFAERLCLDQHDRNGLRKERTLGRRCESQHWPQGSHSL
jgi:drug/metabolite transporter (DMT)-like permease